MAAWTDERKQELGAHVAAGLVSIKIGQLMGLSKGSIISACSRFGFKLRASKTGRPGKSGWKKRKAPPPPAAPTTYVPPPPDEFVPARAVSLFDLESGQCRWMVGALYCGDPTAATYCEHHSRLAYAPRQVYRQQTRPSRRA